MSGSLVFGVDTQTNNGLAGAQIFTVDPNYGYITSVFNGHALTASDIDSGSNGLYFSSAITNCTLYPYFYCPAATQTYSTVIQGMNTAQASIAFSVANTNTLFANGNATFTAFNDLAGSSSSTTFDWGLPFFLGRNVFVVREGENVGGSTDPFVAF